MPHKKNKDEEIAGEEALPRKKAIERRMTELEPDILSEVQPPPGGGLAELADQLDGMIEGLADEQKDLVAKAASLLREAASKLPERQEMEESVGEGELAGEAAL